MLVVRDGLLMMALALGVAACGESSAEVSDHDDGGASGSAPGGTSATGGNAGEAPEGGSSGTASGGASAGTSSGNGGSVSGGGGTSGSSGASTGGVSGSAGTGGTAGRGYRPPDNQLMGCIHLCELERAAMCTAETSFEKCIEDCHLGILFEVCTERADELFACVGAVDSAECSASGTAVILQCGADARALNDCILSDGITDAPTACALFCTAAAEPMCPGTDYDECSAWCQVVSSAFPVCARAFETFLDCGAGSEQACNADGEAEAPGCAATFGSFLDCLDADYAWQPGLGIVR